jgi:hypothetical protein
MKKRSIVLVLLSLLLIDVIGVIFAINFGVFQMNKPSANDTAAVSDPAVADVERHADMYTDVNEEKDIQSYDTDYMAEPDATDEAQPTAPKTSHANSGKVRVYGSVAGRGSGVSDGDEQKQMSIKVFFLTEKREASIFVFAGMICICIGLICTCAVVYCFRAH